MYEIINWFSAGFLYKYFKEFNDCASCSLHVLRDNNNNIPRFLMHLISLIVLLPIVNFELRSYFHQHLIANDIIQFIDTEFAVFFFFLIHIFVLYLFILMCK